MLAKKTFNDPRIRRQYRGTLVGYTVLPTTGCIHVSSLIHLLHFPFGPLPFPFGHFRYTSQACWNGLTPSSLG